MGQWFSYNFESLVILVKVGVDHDVNEKNNQVFNLVFEHSNVNIKNHSSLDNLCIKNSGFSSKSDFVKC